VGIEHFSNNFIDDFFSSKCLFRTSVIILKYNKEGKKLGIGMLGKFSAVSEGGSFAVKNGFTA